MDTRQLEYIVAIAEEKNLLRAAEKLFVSSSALSQALSKLEASVGSELFVRTKSGLIPTETGLLYIDMAYDVLYRERKTIKLIQEKNAGSIERFSIGVTSGRGTAMFSAIYPIFAKSFPNVNISLSDGTGVDVKSKLINGEVDLAFLPGAFVSKNVSSFLLVREALMLAVPSSHPLAFTSQAKPAGTFPSIELSQFKNEDFMLMYPKSSVRKTTDQMCSSAGFQPKCSFQASSMEALDNLSKNGFGIAFVHEFYANANNPLVKYFYTIPPGYSDLCFAVRQGYVLTPSQKHLIELAKAYFRHELNE